MLTLANPTDIHDIQIHFYSDCWLVGPSAKSCPPRLKPLVTALFMTSEKFGNIDLLSIERNELKNRFR